MNPLTDRSDPSPQELAQLSALADGTLDPARRESVQAMIDASPELTALYKREVSAVSALQSLRADRAPAALRTRIEAERERRTAPLRAWRIGYGGALAGALAVIALALVLILPAGTPGGPSVSQAAALATRGPAAPAPAAGPREPSATLGTNVGSVYFPDWTHRFGWTATGQRSDRLGGRLADTVYYRSNGNTLAYTIVAAPALRTPSAKVTQLNGTTLRTLRLNGRLVVTWRRDGRTCILSSAAGVPASTLQQLAASSVPGSGRR
jgi:hypothetical protein